MKDSSETIYNSGGNSSILSPIPTISIYSRSSLPFSSSINWEVIEPLIKVSKKSVKISASGEKLGANKKVKTENLPLFFNQGVSVRIPKTVEQRLKRNVPKDLIEQVHPKSKVAIELCLLLLSDITPTLLRREDARNNDDQWRYLGSRYLRSVFNNDPKTYQNIINVLKYEGEEGCIIEVRQGDNPGIKASKFRYSEKYSSKKIIHRVLQSEYVIGLARKSLLENYQSGKSNPIFNNLCQLYSIITLPTLDEIIKEARRLIDLKYVTKKGEILAFLNKHSKNYFKDSSKYSFVEDAIKIYNYLTQGGLLIPIIGGEKCGSRVFDSLNLLPCWIRSMIKIDGEYIEECDYACLHPNLAIKLYNGTQRFLTHEFIAEKIGVSKKQVKVDHLSYFNREVWDMKRSSVHPFYEEYESNMLKAIFRDKYRSKNGYKSTSHRMFTLEVDILKAVISELNREDIYVGYVFDALFCQPKHKDKVRDIMNKVILDFGVYTVAK